MSEPQLITRESLGTRQRNFILNVTKVYMKQLFEEIQYITITFSKQPLILPFHTHYYTIVFLSVFFTPETYENII